MGGAVKTFFKGVAKAVVTHVGGLVPVVGAPIASYINSKYAKGSFDVGALGVPIPADQGTKPVNTPAQLKALVEKFPEEAQKAGLTKDMITQEVKEAKEQAKAIGGLIKMKSPHYPKGTQDKFTEKKFAKGGKVRSKAQIEATARLVALNRARKAKK